MIARKHFEGGRVFVYLTARRTTILSFESEDEMRRAGQCLIDLARIGGNEVEIKEKDKE